ncbi:thioesterase [Nocardioides dubius]|uniref:Fluoroacetyl-CoA-specific thioesterase-like domain-containing protein n=1 Tax=Nocardioides dubius TaxID=317019 RepID=A0ABN1TJH7_9ACTN
MGTADPLRASARFTVTDEDTAQAVGSGSLPVLGTPRLLAWCESVTCAAIEPLLTPGRTSVGTRVDLEHLAASGVGAEIEVEVSAAYTEPRLVRFTVAARMGAKLVGSGEITRVVVDAERFLSRLSPRAQK